MGHVLRTPKERPNLVFSPAPLPATHSRLQRCILGFTGHEGLPPHLAPFKHKQLPNQDSQIQTASSYAGVQRSALNAQEKMQVHGNHSIEDPTHRAAWLARLVRLDRALLIFQFSVETSLPPENLPGPPKLGSAPFSVAAFVTPGGYDLLCWWQEWWLVRNLLEFLSCQTQCLADARCSLYCCGMMSLSGNWSPKCFLSTDVPLFAEDSQAVRHLPQPWLSTHRREAMGEGWGLRTVTFDLLQILGGASHIIRMEMGLREVT